MKTLFRNIHKGLFTVAPYWKQLRYLEETEYYLAIIRSKLELGEGACSISLGT